MAEGGLYSSPHRDSSVLRGSLVSTSSVTEEDLIDTSNSTVRAKFEWQLVTELGQGLCTCVCIYDRACNGLYMIKCL